jgi:hypothetical protein
MEKCQAARPDFVFSSVTLRSNGTNFAFASQGDLSSPTVGACGRCNNCNQRKATKILIVILSIAVLVALVAALPIWPHSRTWSFYPISGIALVILVILYLVWSGRI